MVNRERGEASLVLGGVTYTLHLSLNSLCKMEETLGADGQASFAQLAGRLEAMRVSDLRAVLWAALQDRHAETFPTPESVGALIGMGDLPAILPALTQALAVDPADVQELTRGRPRTAQATRGRLERSISEPARSA